MPGDLQIVDYLAWLQVVHHARFEAWRIDGHHTEARVGQDPPHSRDLFVCQLDDVSAPELVQLHDTDSQLPGDGQRPFEVLVQLVADSSELKGQHSYLSRRLDWETRAAL